MRPSVLRQWILKYMPWLDKQETEETLSPYEYWGKKMK